MVAILSSQQSYVGPPKAESTVSEYSKARYTFPADISGAFMDAVYRPSKATARDIRMNCSKLCSWGCLRFWARPKRKELEGGFCDDDDATAPIKLNSPQTFGTQGWIKALRRGREPSMAGHLEYEWDSTPRGIATLHDVVERIFLTPVAEKEG
jgi:hypothetical protein